MPGLTITTTIRRDDIPTPRITSLFDWWNAKRGGRAMPVRADFFAEELAPWWNDMILYEIDRATVPCRFRFRVHGANSVILDGDNFTGRYLDEALPPDMAHPILDCYHAVEAAGRPLYSHGHRPSVRGYDARFERLLIPFGERRVSHIVAFLLAHKTPREDPDDAALASRRTLFVNDLLAFVVT
jgi:hypothetical protein